MIGLDPYDIALNNISLAIFMIGEHGLKISAGKNKSKSNPSISENTGYASGFFHF